MPDPYMDDIFININRKKQIEGNQKYKPFSQEIKAINKADKAGNLTDQDRIEGHKRASNIYRGIEEQSSGSPVGDDIITKARLTFNKLSPYVPVVKQIREIFKPWFDTDSRGNITFNPNKVTAENYLESTRNLIKYQIQNPGMGYLPASEEPALAPYSGQIETIKRQRFTPEQLVLLKDQLLQNIDPNSKDPGSGNKTRNILPEDNPFHQLVISLDQERPYKLTPPGKFTKVDTPIPESNRFDELTYQEIQALGPAFKSYMGKRPYKDAATPAGMERMQIEVNKTFEQLLGPDFDQDLVRGYMKAVADHEGALAELQRIMNDKTGKLWDKQHATALRHLEHSGRMLGNKGLFPAFNFPDVLDQTPLGKPKVKIEREGNRPDRTARGADFQRTLARVLGKPLSLEESILYWYDQDMFYFWKELTPLQRQQLVDSSRTRSGGRLKSELTVAENINQALESMKFGKETMSGKLGRKLTTQERLEALVSQAQAELLKKRKYKGIDLKSSPIQGNVFYDVKTGIETDYRPDLTGKGAYWDIESE